MPRRVVAHGLRQGTLKKCSHRLRLWSDVWVVLHSGELHIHRDPCAPARKCVPLPGASVVEADADESKRQFCFKVTQPSSGVTLFLSAADRSDLESWVSALRGVVSMSSPLETHTRCGSGASHQDALDLFRELAAIVTAADQMASLVVSLAASSPSSPGSPSGSPGGSPRTSPKLAPLSPRVMEVGGRLGADAVEIAGIAGIIAVRRNAASAKQASTHLQGLLSTVAELLQGTLLEGRDDADTRDLRGAAESVFVMGADIVFRLACEGTLPEQLKVRVLENSRLLSKAVAAVARREAGESARALEALRANAEGAVRAVCGLHTKSGDHVPLFVCAALPPLCADFSALAICEDCPEQQASVLECCADGLRSAFSYVLSLCDLYDSIPQSSRKPTIEAVLSRLSDESAAVSSIPDNESLRSVAAPTAAFASYLRSVINQAPFFQNTDAIDELADAVSPLLDRLDWAYKAVLSENFTCADALDDFTRTYLALVGSAHILASALGSQSTGLCRSVVHAIHFAESVMKVAKNAVQFLVSASSLKSHMRRKTAFFEEGELKALQLAESEAAVAAAQAPSCASLQATSTWVIAARTDSGTSDDPEESERSRPRSPGSQEDVSIWTEPSDNPKNIVTDDNGVKLANLNKLVERLTMVGCQDLTFQKTFITTYRSFTTPDVLFKKLLERYTMQVPHLPPSVSSDEYYRLFVMPVQLRIINVLRQWLETSFFDFTEGLIERVRRWIEDDLAHGDHQQFAKQLSHVLKRQLELRRQEIETEKLEVASIDGSCDHGDIWKASTACKGVKARKSNGSALVLSSGSSSPLMLPSEAPARGSPLQMRGVRRTFSSLTAMSLSGFNLALCSTDETVVSCDALQVMQFPPDEVARQMTYFDSHFYRLIRPVELLDLAWSKHKEQAPNVLALCNRFNEVSLWASSLVLSQRNVEGRAAVWTRLCDIGDALLRLRNFNTLLALFASFNNTSIHRLRTTKQVLPQRAKKLLDTVQALYNPEGAYRAYRETLHTCDPPCLPYLGVSLTDLTFIEEGNPNVVDGMINFRKRKLVYNIISEVQLYQQTPYSITPDMSILQHIHTLPHRESEEELYAISLVREPRPPIPVPCTPPV